MVTEIRVPVRGEGMDSCLIAEWFVGVGDRVAVGSPLFSIETAKAIYEVPSTVAGRLTGLLAQVGDEVAVHAVVATIASDGDIAVDDIAVDEIAADGTAAAASESAGVERVAASPLARKAAAAAGISLADVTGTGPGGRATVRDVQKLRSSRAECSPAAPAAPASPAMPGPASAPASTPAPAPVASPKPSAASGLRQAIAEHMTRSAAVPTVTLHRRADARALTALADRLRPGAERWGHPRPTLNDLVCAVVARVVTRHPALNGRLRDGAFAPADGVDLGVAVATPDGLVVPVVRGADQMTLGALAGRIRELGSSARDRSIAGELLRGSTFTVTNLGGLGVEHFTPLLNLPEVAVLGVGSVTPGVLPDGQIGPVLGLSLTFDHRAADGAVAAALLTDLVDAIADADTVLTL